MNYAAIKIKHIFFPFFFLELGVIAGYSILTWLLMIHGAWVWIDENMIITLVPLLLTWVPLYHFLRPRFRLFDVDVRKGHDLIYLALAGFFTIVPMIIAQHYIRVATSKTTELSRITDLESVPQTRYYSVAAFFIDIKRAVSFQSTVASGTHAEKITTTVYISSPIRTDPADTLPGADRHWFGVKYTESLENKGDTAAVSHFLHDVRRRNLENFKKTVLPPDICFERLGMGKDLKGFRSAVYQAKLSEKSEEPVVFIAVTIPLVQRTGSLLKWLLGFIMIGSAIMMTVIMVKPLHKERFATFLERLGF